MELAAHGRNCSHAEAGNVGCGARPPSTPPDDGGRDDIRDVRGGPPQTIWTRARRRIGHWVSGRV